MNDAHNKYDKAFSNNYAGACDERADAIFEEILEIADESQNDIKTLEDGRKVTDTEVVQRSRVRIDARKWVLGRMKPKKYGDKLDVTTKGEELKSTTIINLGKGSNPDKEDS